MILPVEPRSLESFLINSSTATEATEDADSAATGKDEKNDNCSYYPRPPNPPDAYGSIEIVLVTIGEKGRILPRKDIMDPRQCFISTGVVGRVLETFFKSGKVATNGIPLSLISGISIELISTVSESIRNGL